MKLRDILQRATASDPDWHDPMTEAKSQFDFAPTDTSEWPMAVFSPNLIDAARLGELGASGYSTFYRTQPSVYTVVEFLAWQISQIGIKVYRREDDGEKTHLQDSPITRILAYPAEGLTYERFIHSTVADLCVYGNAYWRKMQQGSTRSLVPLRPYMVTPRGGTILAAGTYDVATAGGSVSLDAEEVVHFRRHNPDDMRIGVSPLEPLRSILREEREASADRIGFWANSARVGGILQFKGTLSDDAYERIQRSWLNAQAGARNSGKTAILEEDGTFKETAFSPKDAEFIAGRKLALETVARAFNVPVSVLGLTDTATYASQKEFHKALYQDTLGPWLAFLEGEIKSGVVEWFTSDTAVFVEFNIAEKLKGSPEEQADALRAQVGVPVLSVNEWRAIYNLPRIEDDRFDIPVMPANVAYGGATPNGQIPALEDPAALAAAPAVTPIRATS